MWRLPYNSVLFTIWGLKLALCWKFPYLLRSSDVFVSKNRPKGHGIWLFLVIESHEKSWNLNFQKEYEPWRIIRMILTRLGLHYYSTTIEIIKFELGLRMFWPTMPYLGPVIFRFKKVKFRFDSVSLLPKFNLMKSRYIQKSIPLNLNYHWMKI